MQYLLKNRTEHNNALYEEFLAYFSSPRANRTRMSIILGSSVLIVLAAWYGYDSNCLGKAMACLWIFVGTVNVERMCFADKIFVWNSMRPYKKWDSDYREIYFYETCFDLCNRGIHGMTRVYYADVKEFTQSEHYFFLVTYDDVACALQKDGFEGLTAQEAEQFLRERIPVR